MNIGAGTTDIAVLSLKGVASSTSIRVGGDDMDESIVRYLHNKHNHIIGHLTAEQVKYPSAARAASRSKVVGVKGRNIITGLSVYKKISRYEIFEAMQEPISQILLAIQRVLETTPPNSRAILLKAAFA